MKETKLSKRLDGRDETILDPDLPIIDAHHHMRTGYMFEELVDDANAGHNIKATVYVESRTFMRTEGPEALRPIGEIEYANGVGSMGASGVYGPCRVASAIVGYANLTFGDEIGAFFDRAMAAAPDRFRGIRQPTLEHASAVTWRYVPHPPPSGLLEHPGFRPGFKQLASRGLTFDAAIFSQQLPAIAELADVFPDTTIILDHMGLIMALETDQRERNQLFKQWQSDLTDIAARPNVVCKVGGLGLAYWGFGFEDRTDAIGYQELAGAWKPYVESAIEVFGADRCMLESNFPADAVSCGYVPLWNALKYVVKDASEAEKAALFHGTAERVYQISPVA
jgi:predicted TIM-barrel fold metal-dependent hydrolase